HERGGRSFLKEDKQINTEISIISVYAASGLEVDWHGIDWAKCHQQVRRLQARIVKATQEGHRRKVKSLDAAS
ncbi:MAG: reverse transcriptase N-terminal domain-containing protein, partial [Methylococcales bacterium]